MEKIKKLNKKELKQFVSIVYNAYPGYLETPEALEKLRDNMLKEMFREKGTAFYGLFRDNKLLGGMRFFDFEMNFMNRLFPVGGLGFVAVDYLHKKEKVAKAMLEFFHQHYYEHNYSITALYPFHPEFYYKMGYAFASPRYKYSLKPESFPDPGDKSGFEFLTEKDADRLHDCYSEYLRSQNGLFKRTPEFFKRLFKEKNNRLVGIRQGNRLRGYILFSFRNVPGDNVDKHNMVIHEMIFNTREVLAGIFTFLRSQRDQINRIILYTPDPDFFQISPDPRFEGDVLVRHNMHKTCESGLGVMFRIINPGNFFNQAHHLRTCGKAVKIQFNIEDNFFPVNNQSLIVKFGEEPPKIMKSGTPDLEINLTVNNLTKLLLGIVSTDKLYQFGLINLNKTEYLQQINEIFFTGKPVICYNGF